MRDVSLAERVRRMGRYTGVRWLRNNGFTFEEAHRIVLGCPPRSWTYAPA